jgi:prevent-host-death family protein
MEMTVKETIKASDITPNPLVVSTEELRVNLADYLAQVRYTDAVVVVEKYNRETAFILSPRMLRRLIDSTQATKADREVALKEMDAILSKVPDIDPKVYNKAINKAVKEVRAQKRRQAKRA